MLIKVVCTECHSSSQVEAAAQGAQATCPFCASTFDVPAAGEQQAVEAAAPVDPFADESVAWGQMDTTICIRHGFELYKSQPRALLVAHVVNFLGLSLAFESVVLAGTSGVGGVLQMFALALMMFFKVGLTLIGLRVARNKSAELPVLFAGARVLPRFIVANIVLVVLFVVGCIGFVVPGIYLLTRFWSAGMFVVDKKCTVSEAFAMAGQFSEGNRLPSLMLGLICFGMMVMVSTTLVLTPIFGNLPFLVAMLLISPWLTMIWTVAYLMITRQPIYIPPEREAIAGPAEV